MIFRKSEPLWTTFRLLRVNEASLLTKGIHHLTTAYFNILYSIGHLHLFNCTSQTCFWRFTACHTLVAVWEAAHLHPLIRSSFSFPSESVGLESTVQLGCKQRDLCYGCNCGTNGWVNWYQLYCRPTFLGPSELRLSYDPSSDESQGPAGEFEQLFTLDTSDKMFKEHNYQRFVRHMQPFGDMTGWKEQSNSCNKSTQTRLCVFLQVIVILWSKPKWLIGKRCVFILAKPGMNLVVDNDSASVNAKSIGCWFMYFAQTQNDCMSHEHSDNLFLQHVIHFCSVSVAWGFSSCGRQFFFLNYLKLYFSGVLLLVVLTVQVETKSNTYWSLV